MDDSETTHDPIPKILVVDDDKGIRDLIRQMVEIEGFDCSVAEGGLEAVEYLNTHEVDVVLTDVRMPGMDGIELTRTIQELHGADVIVMTGYAKGISYDQVIEIGASDFVQKPLGARELMTRIKRVLRERKLLADRLQAGKEIQESFERLQRALEQTVNALTSTVEMKDPYTSGHQRRVTRIASAIGEMMGLSETQLDGLRIAGLLHDIGKISVPSEILSKPGRLTTAEFSLLKEHPRTGYGILKEIEFPWPVAQIMLQHHERIDGSGYPDGLKGDEIFQEARILSVADVVEAISSHRPYREALGIDVALDEITKNRGITYDSDAVDACLTLFQEKNYTVQ